MPFTYQEQQFNIVQYPETSNKSLRAWNAGDEYVLSRLEELGYAGKSMVIYNDWFGFLSTILHDAHPYMVIEWKSQEKAIVQNLKAHDFVWEEDRSLSPLQEVPEAVDIAIIQIPKTLDLFKLYLQHASQSLKEDGVILCAFMTKYFSPQMLTIAEEFFEEVDQSLAKKKSRILTLKGKKKRAEESFVEEIPFSFSEGNEESLKQYPGVFSSGSIDYATQFLIEHLSLSEENQKVLDLASGNGVIARAAQIQKPEAEIHLVDDSRLAIESSKLNMNLKNAHFHWDDTLDGLEKGSFDLVVSNPPFHFGHETNIEVSIQLFKEVSEILKPGGKFICVANQHLNFKTHLNELFAKGEVLANSKKFILYKVTA
jgi:16S rRNA G1207 methylase RsmC